MSGSNSTTSLASNDGAIKLPIPNATGTTDTDGGIEFLTSTTGLGYGWRILNADLTGGDTPLIFQFRNGATAWTTALSIDKTGNLVSEFQAYSKLNDRGSTAAGTITIDWNAGNTQSVTASTNSGAYTFAFSNVKAGATYILRLKQPSGGAATAAWPAAVKWSGGTTPTWTATANKVDVFTFVVYDSSNIYGSYVQNFS
jgi:hypothetical protein